MNHIGFWFLFMGLLCIIFLICSLRTNVAFFVIFLSLAIAFGLLTGAFWAQADDFAGNADYAHKLLVVRTPIICIMPSQCLMERELRETDSCVMTFRALALQPL